MSQSSAPFPKVMVASIYVGIAGVNITPGIKFHRRDFENTCSCERYRPGPRSR
jgi:hypothetical protein